MTHVEQLCIGVACSMLADRIFFFMIFIYLFIYLLFGRTLRLVGS